ncbi:N-acetylmuramoyl-L-alanine amidase [Nocardioides sp.]|uniref:peptidoglycan recognition protein family protein n=1 Tax=Nocardioides sp. TaxID=35761 RepID=UPI00321A074B
MRATDLHDQPYTEDPGAEVVDLADELVPDLAELGRVIEVPQGFVNVQMDRTTGHATDYEWCTWLADVLRGGGCSVEEFPGWKTRGRPRSVGPFTPRGVIWHHDASAKGSSPGVAAFIATQGRPAEGIPAPLSELWVCMGCNGAHPVGTWHVLAAGRANHAGIGEGWGAIGANMGTSLTLGVETDNTVGEDTPPAMLASLVLGTAAIMKRLRSDPARWLCGHKEYSTGRKIDPDDIDMARARADVAASIARPSEPERKRPPVHKKSRLMPWPGGAHFTPKHRCTHGHIDKLKDWLNEVDPKAPALKGPTYTQATRDRVREFQKSDKRIKDHDGVVGPKTWAALQRKAGV